MTKSIKAISGFAVGLVTVVFSGLGVAQTAPSAPLDPHQIYEKNCNSCHTEQGADLARQRLAVKGDQLIITRTGKDVMTVIRNHHGVKPTPAELASLAQLFRNGITWGGVYQHRCAGCHERAVSFARSTLKLEGDKVVGVKDGRDVASFLQAHGEATAPEIGTLIIMLKWQLSTAPKP